MCHNLVDKIYTVICAENTAANLGFVNGFLWGVDNLSVMTMINQPFSTSIIGTSGGGAGLLAGVVTHHIMPHNFKWIPSTLLIGSLAVMTFNRLQNIYIKNKQIY